MKKKRKKKNEDEEKNSRWSESEKKKERIRNKKKKVRWRDLSLVVGLMNVCLITKMLLETELWKLKTPKMCF